MRITPTQHCKNEWSRMAQAAYSKGFNSIGHTYSTAASLPNAGTLPIALYDSLQADYRAWLIGGTMLAAARSVTEDAGRYAAVNRSAYA